MNSGRKKAATATSLRMSSISKMFPVSWFSRLRNGNGSSGGRRVKEVKKKAEKEVELEHEIRRSGAEKFYREAEENFWRLSFSDEGVQGRKSRRGCSRSVSSDWHNEMDFSPSTCRSCGAKGGAKEVVRESLDFENSFLDRRKTRDSHRHIETRRDRKGETKGEPRSSKVSRRDCNLRNLDLHQMSHSRNRVAKYASSNGSDKKSVGGKGGEGDPSIQDSSIKDILEVKPVKPSSSSSHKQHHEASPSSELNQTEEGDLRSAKLRLQGSSVCENFEEVKLAEWSVEDGEERKSIYISKESMKRRSKSGKVKVYSPRTPSKAELCKIRALEDLKKARMKMRIKEEEEKERELLESFAVVKCSFDPQKDFRNSMLEMILDQGISRPEELEELLACYLTLNSDEYHDLIIKVFRQVWFDLNKDRLDSQSRGGEIYYN